MTKSKNLFKNISIFLCLIPMLLLSLFVAFPKNNIKSVSAVENSFTFSYGDYSTFATVFQDGSLHVGNHFVSFTPEISYSNGEYTYKVNGLVLYGETTFRLSLEKSINESSIVDQMYSDYTGLTFTDVPNHEVAFLFRIVGKFNGNVEKIVLSTTDSGGCLLSNVIFYDTNGATVCFSPRYDYLNESDFGIWSQYFWDSRTYYTGLYYSSDANYQLGYDAGYSDGYTSGNSDGNSQGYQDGYSAGQSIGYGNGYNDGIEQSGQYSFNSLIGAVIDAPVSAFTSLLNFEILGINILGFISGLLTLALIIFIIKLCMGGK